MNLDTAVIPCGGLGRRLRPITNWVPKEMLPVGLKPLLYWALDEAAVAGLMRVVLVVNPHKPIIEAAARQYQGPLELEFVPQPSYRGLGDALLATTEVVGRSPFVLLQPDQLFDGPNPTTSVLAGWRATGRTTVGLVHVDSETGSRTAALGRASVRHEKGTLHIKSLEARGSSLGRFGTVEGKALAPVGRVAFSADALSVLEEVASSAPPGAELDDRPLLQRLAERGELDGVELEAGFYDIGVPEGYRAAVSRWPAQVS
jgi:UTP-glucose-1-phosphate uridylyltransferase